MKYVYSMIIDNIYDYDDPAKTTDDIETVYAWLREGVKEVAMLDALSLEYYGYLDFEDLPEFKASQNDF